MSILPGRDVQDHLAEALSMKAPIRGFPKRGGGPCNKDPTI